MEFLALQRIRRNHAIEHAAMHLLGALPRRSALMARSDWRGMTFYGDVDTATLSEAIRGGIKALNTGRRRLAIHPRCGSMVSVSVLLGFGSAWAARNGLRRIPAPLRALATLATIGSALTLARPLGEATQARLLTDADTGGAELVALKQSRVGNVTVHRATITHA